MSYTIEQQKTFLETLQARIEQSEKGSITDLFKFDGKFTVVPIELPKLVKFFMPSTQPEIDEYGNIKNP